MTETHKRWFSRGYLPHFDHPNLLQALTFRLADSLPESVLQEMVRELALCPPSKRKAEKEKRLAEYLDAGYGSCCLRDPRIADLVESALLHFDGERYRLLAWCVMPNHVHALIEVFAGFPLSEVVHSWKSYSAKRANRILGRSGELWQREYHDRFIRDERHFRKAVVYIESNPMRAGLVAAVQDWRYTSAWMDMEAIGG